MLGRVDSFVHMQLNCLVTVQAALTRPSLRFRIPGVAPAKIRCAVSKRCDCRAAILRGGDAIDTDAKSTVSDRSGLDDRPRQAVETRFP